MKKLLMLKFLCIHKYVPHGWTTARCEICGKKTKNKTKVIESHHGYWNRKEEGMRNLGFSEEFIKEDMQPLKSTLKLYE